ncbi:thermonuclease family protein [Patescibacteria group bacterium]|nr:thermonuclease family protein [Patescibacteria group bacterium]
MDNIFLLIFLFSPIALVIGLIKPSVFSRFSKTTLTRKKIATFFIVTTIASFVGFGVTSDYENTNQLKSLNNEVESDTSETQENADTNTSNDEFTNKQVQAETFKVTRVIDGDTIEIEGGRKVRYIGIDTPETVHPSEPVECFGEEASDENKRLLEGKQVRLEKDISEVDKYDRLLRYVWVGDVFVNDHLVRQGYANSTTYPPDVKYQEQFREAEQEARENNRGFWSKCNAEPTSAPVPTQTVVVQPTQPVTVNSSSCKYSCSGPDRDCADFSTHAEAQAFFECCGFTATNDPMRLDGVKVDDGIACESLP